MLYSVVDDRSGVAYQEYHGVYGEDVEAALRLLEAYGVETPDGHVQAPPGLLTKATVNRYLQRWGYDWATLRRPPPAVRLQAR